MSLSTPSKPKSEGGPSGYCSEVSKITTILRSPLFTIIRPQLISPNRFCSGALFVFGMKTALVRSTDAKSDMHTKVAVSVSQLVHFPKELDDE